MTRTARVRERGYGGGDEAATSLRMLLSQLGGRRARAGCLRVWEMKAEKQRQQRESRIKTMKHQLDHEAAGDGTTEQLARWVAGLRAEEVPERVLERAKHLILDGIGCGLVGARVPWSEKMLHAVSQYEPEGPCSVIGSEKVCAFNTTAKWKCPRDNDPVLRVKPHEPH